MLQGIGEVRSSAYSGMSTSGVGALPGGGPKRGGLLRSSATMRSSLWRLTLCYLLFCFARMVCEGKKEVEGKQYQQIISFKAPFIPRL